MVFEHARKSLAYHTLKRYGLRFGDFGHVNKILKRSSFLILMNPAERPIRNGRSWGTYLLFGILGLGPAYFALHAVVGYRNQCINERHTSFASVDELEACLSQEKRTLGLEDLTLPWGFSDRVDVAGTLYNNDKEEYSLIFNGMPNRANVRHELWHVYEIKNGILREPILPFQDLLAEWRAANHADR